MSQAAAEMLELKVTFTDNPKLPSSKSFERYAVYSAATCAVEYSVGLWEW